MESDVIYNLLICVNFDDALNDINFTYFLEFSHFVILFDD